MIHPLDVEMYVGLIRVRHQTLGNDVPEMATS
jgi:hypothetical protein